MKFIKTRKPKQSNHGGILPLTANVISNDEPAYSSVTELAEAIENKQIQNIAVTGPYGSGKSTVLNTLRQDYKKNHYLSISLATLNSDLRLRPQSGETFGKDNINTANKEESDRLIEYSLVQQLIYKENAKILPNSRIKKIVHYSKFDLVWRPLAYILFLLATWKITNPQWLRIESLSTYISSWGYDKYEYILDLICVIYIFICLFIFFRRVITSYCNSKLNKLNLKNGEIEIKEDTSIFNKHLDEIIYFFQATKYDTVIIEDLDRYENPDIFLKLRELNFILNNARKSIGRKITFIYAIRDDMFKDKDRTKFFDYIITVIPVINYSNSKDKLINALRAKGYDVPQNFGLPIDDIEEIAFFIDDMRLLKNIVN